MAALMLDEICEYLVAFTPAITVGNPGVAISWNTGTNDNLFGYEMPNSPAACVSVVVYGGAMPHLIDSIDEPTFQVRIRDVIATTGEGTAQAIFNALHGVFEQPLVVSGDWHWNRIFAIQNPIYLGKDDVNRHNWCQNFRGFVRNPNRYAEAVER
jgi:hypothetical protein